MSDAGQKIIEGLKEAVAGNFARVHIPDATGKLQTWYRVDAEGGALLTGHADDNCPGCGRRLGDLPDDPVTVPRAQLEALKAAAHFVWLLYDLTGRQPPGGSWNALLEKTIAALRAAGIHETEGGETCTSAKAPE